MITPVLAEVSSCGFLINEIKLNLYLFRDDCDCIVCFFAFGFVIKVVHRGGNFSNFRVCEEGENIGWNLK